MAQAIAAIPTIYKGRQYRSRLEARWAAFFDLLDWSVEYEPCDFNGWIPDFVINGAETVYVEVKPVSQFPEDVARKLEVSGCPSEMLIVGQSLPSNQYVGPCVGWLTERHADGFCWGLAPFGLWESNNRDRIIGFCHEEQGYSDRITGSYDGGCHGSGNAERRVAQAWAEAGNAVQWKSPR